MPSLIDIRRRIRSVKNTQQITKAMKMVSAAKLRRAQDRVISSRPYGALLRKVLEDLAAAVASDERTADNPLLAQRPEKRTLLVLITGDKGLAGAFNSNLIKAAQAFVAERAAGSVKMVLVGRKGRDFFRKRKADITSEHINLAAKVKFEDTAAIAQKAMELYRAEEIDAVWLIYNEFKSVVAQKLVLRQVFPIQFPEQRNGSGLYLRGAAGGNAGGAAAALRGNGILPRVVGVRRRGTCGAYDGDGSGHIERRRHDRKTDAVHEPRAAGEHHERDHRSGQWSGGRGVREEH